MATYNGEKYIKKQVDSILCQLGLNDELIISDDESIDNTIAILKLFNDERIKVYQNANKKGPVHNFENALSKAVGEYIFLADQDDIWLSGKIEKHVDLHQEYDLVISDAFVTTENGDIIYESFFKQRGSKTGLIKNLIKNSYIGCCMSFNRRIYDLAMPIPQGIHMHDWWIGLVAEIKGTVVFCEQRLMNYTRHDNNVSPTLGESGYSTLTRFKNRFILFKNLPRIILK